MNNNHVLCTEVKETNHQPTEDVSLIPDENSFIFRFDTGLNEVETIKNISNKFLELA